MGTLQEPNSFRSFMAYYTYNAAKQIVMRDQFVSYFPWQQNSYFPRSDRNDQVYRKKY